MSTTLLRRSHFPELESNQEHQRYPRTKTYQHIFLKNKIRDLLKTGLFIGDIGAHTFYGLLDSISVFDQHETISRAIIDPYNSAGGGGTANLPPDFPYPAILFRCLLGIDSHIIPSNLFDITFSCSVLEHIGQKECNYDLNPTSSPPEKQENPRNAFCNELFRIMKPGGVTLHAIDHAPRNLTFIANFQNAGFTLSEPQQCDLDTALDDPDLIRQRYQWGTRPKPLPMPAQGLRLNSVLYIQAHKPL
jgi:hypothetical protein